MTMTIVFFFLRILAVAPMFQNVLGNGVFQVLIQDFQIDDYFPAWKCCEGDRYSDAFDELTFGKCLAKCHFVVKVCLETHHSIWSAKRTTSCPLGSSSAQLPGQRPEGPLLNLSFPIEQHWQENFTLILDILHLPGGNSNSPKLLFRLPSNEVNFSSFQNWKIKSFGSPVVGQGGVKDDRVLTDAPGDHDKQWIKEHSQQKGSIGLKIVTLFRLTCLAGFHGPLCDQECEGLECRGLRADSVCPSGYEGKHCDKPICQQGCRHGECMDPNVCKCQQGWGGEDCSKCRVYPGCKHGTCQVDNSTGYEIPFTCACITGWGGMLCDIDLQFCQNNPSICKNHGKCENAQSANNQPYRCVCPPGFRGDHCEMIQIDCQVHGCRNGGECTQHSDGQSRCMCPGGYYGSLCQFNQTNCAESPCQAPNSVCQPIMAGRGQLLPRSGHRFVCICPPGYSGENCEINNDDCASKPCKNGAFCEDLVSSYTCICPSGYMGVWCQDKIATCTLNSCPKGTECISIQDGFRCTPVLKSKALEHLSASVDAYQKELDETEDTFGPLDHMKKNNVVMVHLQPSFLSLTIGVPVAIVFCGLLSVIVTCMLIAVCIWRRAGVCVKQTGSLLPRAPSFSSKPPPTEAEPNTYASETSTIWSTYEPLTSVCSMTGKGDTLPNSVSSSSFYPSKKSTDVSSLELLSKSNMSKIGKSDFGSSLKKHGNKNSKCKQTEKSETPDRATPIYQRYSDNPSRPYSVHLVPSIVYGRANYTSHANPSTIPALPPRSKARHMLGYQTLMRPVLYPINRSFHIGEQALLTPPKMSESAYATANEFQGKSTENDVICAVLRSKTMGKLSDECFKNIQSIRSRQIHESSNLDVPEISTSKSCVNVMGVTLPRPAEVGHEGRRSSSTTRHGRGRDKSTPRSTPI